MELIVINILSMIYLVEIDKSYSNLLMRIILWTSYIWVIYNAHFFDIFLSDKKEPIETRKYLFEMELSSYKGIAGKTLYFFTEFIGGMFAIVFIWAVFFVCSIIITLVTMIVVTLNTIRGNMFIATRAIRTTRDGIIEDMYNKKTDTIRIVKSMFGINKNK